MFTHCRYTCVCTYVHVLMEYKSFLRCSLTPLPLSFLLSFLTLSLSLFFIYETASHPSIELTEKDVWVASTGDPSDSTSLALGLQMCTTITHFLHRSWGSNSGPLSKPTPYPLNGLPQAPQTSLLRTFSRWPDHDSGGITTPMTRQEQRCARDMLNRHLGATPEATGTARHL